MTRSWISCCVPKINFLPRAILFYWDIQQGDEIYSGATRYNPRSVWEFISGDLVYTIRLAHLYYETNPSLNYQDFTYQ